MSIVAAPGEPASLYDREVALYDEIGEGYADVRVEDPRLARPIWDALGDARTVVNVGAGAGSYEPRDRDVVAVDPSAVMIAQRPEGAAPAVLGAAERLPFPDDSFDAAMAILTLHHWDDVDAGLREMRRVARRRIVIVTYDPALEGDLWIVRDYLGEHAIATFSSLPPISRILETLPEAEVHPLLIPNDCSDRMFATLWARPEAYLDPHVRAGTSVWQRLPGDVVARAIDDLSRDLASGEWDRRYGHLRTTPAYDAGLRLLTSEIHARTSSTPQQA
jgi:SAM-dependent methyltransferase